MLLIPIVVILALAGRMHRFPQIGAPLHVQPKFRTVAEDTGEDVVINMAHLITSVMPALVAGIHAFLAALSKKTWMAGTSPAMTMWRGYHFLA